MRRLKNWEAEIGMEITCKELGQIRHLTVDTNYTVVDVDYDGWPIVYNDHGDQICLPSNWYCKAKYTIIGERI